MKTTALLLIAAVAPLTSAFNVLRSKSRIPTEFEVEPDTSCGKGFDSLVPGSQSYYTTATNALWMHPGRTGQSGTFEAEGTHYKQAMHTMLDLNKKEVLCMTLFVIDDECGAHEYIRTA